MLNKILHIYRRLFWSYEKYARHNGVKIGKGCNIGTRYFGSEPYLIEIGNHVQITTDVKFFTHSGGWIFRNEFPKLDVFGKIVVGDNVYIGNNALILPGVKIGDNVVIGAGTVVTKSIPSNSVCVGNPGKVISDIETLKQKMLAKNLSCKGMDYEEKKSYLNNLPEQKFILK